ncbi:hypothetical protein MLD38_031841 [Melastoma candidum]|uniref:Uncharacterized protein n=1 Tax=Melastoma candidum TaxID=119954 RepID=A0ACB9MRJ3_9MYRT|nr:hypothetical protein MLD38_031841 [Melastoma candidum]
MKAGRRCQRNAFLCMLAVCVLAPLVFVSHHIKHVSPRDRREFLEDFSRTKFGSDAWRLKLAQEEDAGLEEPKEEVLKDNKLDSLVRNSSGEGGHTDEVKVDGDTEENVRRSGEKNGSVIEDGHSHQNKDASTSSGKEMNDRQQVQNTNARAGRSTDIKVKEMKDQIIRAKAYLHFAPPGSNSHFVKELKLRARELEKAMGDASKDVELHRSALQKSRMMEGLLSKAQRLYPDCSEMATKLRSMAYNAEEQVQAQRKQTEYLLQLAARTTPKGLHCLSMRLTSEYFTVPPEERSVPKKEAARNRDLYHFAVFSDNVLACSVVVNSTVASAKKPDNIVFHVVTDPLNFPAISMWFLQNPPGKAAVDIQSLESFEWLWKKYNTTLQKRNSHDIRFTSPLNHLRFYLPEMFPTLDRILFLDHDVVVQKDLTKLWDIDLKQKVIGAVETCQNGDHSFLPMNAFVNFSDPFISGRFGADSCTWSFGMNLIDLNEWRKKDLTAIYHQYLQPERSKALLGAGSLPLGWLTFYDQVFALDRRWHVLRLGHDVDIPLSDVERGAVLHYDGVRKPWLDIAVAKYKPYWSSHVSYEHLFLHQCNIHP